MEHLEKKIDQIAVDVSYMRGQYDSTIPDMKEKLESHSKQIGRIQNDQSNMKGKVAVAGGLAGMLVTVVVNWFIKH